MALFENIIYCDGEKNILYVYFYACEHFCHQNKIPMLAQSIKIMLQAKGSTCEVDRVWARALDATHLLNSPFDRHSMHGDLVEMRMLSIT